MSKISTADSHEVYVLVALGAFESLAFVPDSRLLALAATRCRVSQHDMHASTLLAIARLSPEPLPGVLEQTADLVRASPAQLWRAGWLAGCATLVLALTSSPLHMQLPAAMSE